jgi:two-component sensor histidine kinase
VDTALPLGLIINELTLNAIKHGFKKEYSKNLNLEIRKDADTSMYFLSFFNSSDLIPEPFNLRNIESLGMEIVSLLVEQIDGDLHISDSNGFLVEIKFPV